MSDYTNYDAAIQAIQDAQQAVDSKYKAIGDASSTLCDVNQTIVQIPDGSVTRNRGGDVIGYDYKYTTPELPDIGIIGVDSNTDTGSFPKASGGGGSSSGGGAGRYRGSYYAGEVVDDPQSTDKAKSTGFVSGLVSSAWAGVSALAKLGKNVAEDAIDSIGNFATHFGESFGSLLVDTADRVGDSVRALFGVDNQGNTSMYLDEDTIGALAIQARDDGFFDSGDESIASLPDDLSDFTQTGVERVNSIVFPVYVNTQPYSIYTYFNSSKTSRCWFIPFYESDTFYYGIALSANKWHGVPNDFRYCVIETKQDYVAFYSFKDTSTLYGASHYNEAKMLKSNTEYLFYDYGASTFKAYNWNSGTIYSGCLSKSKSGETLRPVSGLQYSPSFSNYGYGDMYPYYGWVMFNGAYSGGSTVPGISDQTGATIPVDAITGADPHVVAQNLASQYPAVMGTPVQVVVMDDSCNEKTINYYKVPISYSPTNLNISAPITGGLQVSPSFNPDVQLGLPDINMDNYIDQIIKVLGGSGAGRDVTKEPVPPLNPNIPSANIGGGGVPYEAPNTGTGDTPPTTDPSVAVESMWHVYYATPEQLSALGQWLWSTNIIDQIVRMFQNPMEAIIGVHALYVAPRFSGQVPIVVGNLTSTSNAHPLEAQYQALDCGTVWLTEYFGNVFDYDPFTEVSLYLPFVGVVKLDTADVMRAKISVIYGIDCYTGACLAKVSVNRDGAGGVLYEYPGNCAVEYPVSGASYSRMLQSIVAAAMSAVAVGIKTGGAPGTEAFGAATAGAAFLASGEKISVQRAGSLGGNAGVMGAKIPYLIISRPQPNTAYLFPHYQGIPVNKTVRVSECSGFQRFSSIHLKCPFAYKEELDEIEMLLKKGILI